MLSTLLVVGVISHLWCAARLVGIAHHSFYSVAFTPNTIVKQPYPKYDQGGGKKGNEPNHKFSSVQAYDG